MTRSIQLMASLAIGMFFLGACAKDKEPEACKPGLTNLAPTAAHRYEVNAGQITRFHAEPRACEEGTNYNIRWRLNDEVVSYSNDYDFIACNEDAGVHELYAEAITYASTDTASVEQVVATHKWAVTVRDVSKPATPSCYAQSIRDIQNTKASNDPNDAKKLKAAASCLDTYLESYACDFKASYASGLAKAALLAESLYPLYQERAELTEADISALINDQIAPIRQNFLVVAEKAPEDFSFTVDGRFKIHAFYDDPNLSGNDTIFFEAYGRHDKSEAFVIITFMNYFDGGLSIALANQGFLEFGMKIGDTETPITISQKLIEKMESDPRFMTFRDGVDESGNPLNDGSGAEGQRLMRISQNSFIEAVKLTNSMLARIMSETHDQTNDLVRYWDCGKDAICPATCPYMGSVYFNTDRQPDPAEHDAASCSAANGSYDDKNMNGKCDEGWVKADVGECNQKYDDGEALGTERIGFGAQTQGERLGPSVDIPRVQAVLKMIQDNIRGPDYLDLDKLVETAGFGTNFVTPTLKGLLIPYPVIRISEFFVTPQSFRELVPLYDKKQKQFIIDAENEPFEDTGYDGKLSQDENGYDLVTNRDPNRDDFDLYCNPDCNDNDRLPADHPTHPNAMVDNDGDGVANHEDDSFIPMDLGVEGNFVFDFIDRKDESGNFNGRHDPGEVSEPFKDIGTRNAAGKIVGAGDGAWTFADRAHEPPTGANIGPVNTHSLPNDPPNGVLLEQPDGGLYDYYYYFFQDPTFSGAVRFMSDPKKPEETITSANGELLTDNALLHRFMSKVLNLAEEFNVREANAHPCQLSDYSKCNHWSNPSVGYQP